MKTYPKKLTAGFSLVEVLIALVIGSVSMISMAKFQTDVIKNNAIAKQRTEATVIAQRAIEKYRQLYSKGTVAAIGDITTLKNNTSVAGGNTNFSVQVDDATIFASGDVKLYLTVTWDDLDRTSDNSVQLTTVVSAQPHSQSGVILKSGKYGLAPYP